MQLFQIANEFQQIFNSVDENGELDEQALVKLDAMETAIEEKAIALACYIKNVDAERKAIEDAKKAMAEREKRLDKRVESLTNYLQTNMERCGISEITRSPFFTIKLKKCPLSVDIFDESALPDDYKSRKEVVTIDKMKIKTEINMGVIIPGAQLKQNLRLEIR
jgi:hypothetical protein